MSDSPIDILDQATDALAAVHSLLCSNSSRNMHIVNPDELCALIYLIISQLRVAERGLSGRRT